MIDSSIKFLVYVGVGRLVEQYLTNNGYDALSVRDINPSLPDDEIIKIAADEKRIVITIKPDAVPAR